MPRPLPNAHIIILFALSSTALIGQVPQQIRDSIDRITGREGVYSSDDKVYKIVLPREEATIVWDYQKLSPNLGLNSWAAFKQASHDEATFTGQLLLLEDEVDPVISAALDARLDVTGLASSSVFDGPHLYALDVTARGTFEELATGFRKCLDVIQQVRRSRNRPSVTRPDAPVESSIDPAPLDAVLEMKGTMIGGTYRAAIGTRALLYGESVGREMGMSTWVSVAGTNDRSVAHGDFVTTADDLQNVLKALRAKGISITSIRNHTLGEHPRLVFVHFWGEGSALDLVRAIRFALDAQVGSAATVTTKVVRSGTTTPKASR